MTEHDIQKSLFQWAAYARGSYPGLGLMFAVPNGGKRHVTVARKLKAEGVKAGIPDIFLPVARHGKHGLFLEMKTPKGRVTPKQKVWLSILDEQGYAAHVAHNLDDAIKILTDYLK